MNDCMYIAIYISLEIVQQNTLVNWTLEIDEPYMNPYTKEPTMYIKGTY